MVCGPALHFEGLLDTAPGTPPVPPFSPDLLELGGRATFTADEVEELTLPLETYMSSVETYVADMSVWRNRKENHEKLKSQRGRDMFLGMLLITNAGDKYKKLKDSLDDDYLKGNNTYPNSPENALTMLCDHVPSNNNSYHSNRGRHHGNSSGGNGGNGRNIASNNSTTRSGNVSFLQTGDVVAGVDGSTRPEVQCWSCQAFGHYQDQCPTAVQLLQASIPPHHEGDDGGYELSFNQFGISPPSRSFDNHPSDLGVVMETGSRIDTIKDSELFTNI